MLAKRLQGTSCSFYKSRCGILEKKFLENYKKSHSATKKAKAGPFGFPSIFASIKQFGLVRDSSPCTPASPVS